MNWQAMVHTEFKGQLLFKMETLIDHVIAESQFYDDLHISDAFEQALLGAVQELQTIHEQSGMAPSMPFASAWFMFDWNFTKHKVNWRVTRFSEAHIQRAGNVTYLTYRAVATAASIGESVTLSGMITFDNRDEL